MHKMFRFVQLILFVASEDRSDLFLSFCRDLYDVLLILGAFFFFYSFTLYVILLSSGNAYICNSLRFNVHH
jgi:hypothetical protein